MCKENWDPLKMGEGIAEEAVNMLIDQCSSLEKFAAQEPKGHLSPSLDLTLRTLAAYMDINKIDIPRPG